MNRDFEHFFRFFLPNLKKKERRKKRWERTSILLIFHKSFLFYFHFYSFSSRLFCIIFFFRFSVLASRRYGGKQTSKVLLFARELICSSSSLFLAPTQSSICYLGIVTKFLKNLTYTKPSSFFFFASFSLTFFQLLKNSRASLLYADTHRVDILMTKDRDDGAFDTWRWREQSETIEWKSYCIMGNLALYGCHKDTREGQRGSEKPKRKTKNIHLASEHSQTFSFFLKLSNRRTGGERRKYVANYYRLLNKLIFN